MNLELLNGNWTIVSASLMVICVAYLWHESSARETFRRSKGRNGRTRFTQGMRVAVAMLTTSLGVLIRSAETWRWRVGGGELRDLDQGWLTVGGVIAVVGFLCAIRELSEPLYGRQPWIWTMTVMVIFNLATVILRFW